MSAAGQGHATALTRFDPLCTFLASFILSFLLVLSPVTIFHCQLLMLLVFTIHTLELFPVQFMSPVQSSLCLPSCSSVSMIILINKMLGDIHCLTPLFHFVHLQINVQHVLIYGLLSLFYKHKHKRSFITMDTSCSM